MRSEGRASPLPIIIQAAKRLPKLLTPNSTLLTFVGSHPDKLLFVILCQIPDILFPENEERRNRLQQDSRIHYKEYAAPYGHRFQPEKLHNRMLNDRPHRVDCGDDLLMFFLQQQLH